MCKEGGVCSQQAGNCDTTCGDLYNPAYKRKLSCVNNVWTYNKVTCVPLTPTDFTYSQTDMMFEVNKQMTEILATCKCAECEYKLDGDDIGNTLPEGIHVYTENGTLYGTPTKVQERTAYTMVARNIVGDAKVEVFITIFSEKASYTLIIIIVVCVVLLVGLFGTCMFFRLRGTGRARNRTLKAKQGAGKNTRV